MTREQDAEEQIVAAQSPERVLQILDHLQEYEETARSSILATAFRALATLEYKGLPALGLHHYLALPMEADWLRDFLTDWADQLPSDQKSAVWSQWLQALREEVTFARDVSRAEAAIRMAVAIGFREPELERQLAALSGMMDTDLPDPQPLKDQSLWALTWLGYPDRSELVHAIAERLYQADADGLKWLIPPVRLIPSTGFIKPVVALFERHATDAYPYSGLLWALADIARANPETADSIWDVIEEQTSPEAIRTVSVAGGVSSGFDTPRVVDYFMRQLTDQTVRVAFPDGMGPHYHAYLRLRQLSCPRALQAFHASDLRTDNSVLSTLRADACQDTGHDTHWETNRTMMKKLGLDIALRLSVEEWASWLSEALNETNVFVKGEVCDLAGYVRAEKATDALGYMIRQGDVNVTLAIAATRALGHIGTHAAISALLAGKAERRIGVPQALCDALATAALRVGDASPLLQTVITDPSSPMAMACSAALEQVAAQDARLIPAAELFGAVRTNNERLGKALGFLVATLGYLPASDDALAFLHSFAVSEGDVAVRVREAMARLDALHAAESALSAMGLKRSGEAWTLGRSLDFREARILGILFGNHADLFAPAVALLLREAAYNVAVQILWGLGRNLPDSVEIALAERVQTRIARNEAETEALVALFACAPARFYDLARDGGRQWSAPVRDAFARVLAERPNEDSSAALVPFLSDPVPSTRRIAARYLRDHAGPLLLKQAEHLLRSTDAQDRVCGAQAVGFIHDDGVFDELANRARTDREAVVRGAIRQAEHFRRDRALSEAYLERVLDPAADSVLDVWHFGQALRDVGDDGTAERLERAASNPSYPSNRRAWFAWIAEGVTKHWGDQMREHYRG